MAERRILVIGGGAIGSLLAVRLVAAGNDVTLAARAHAAEVIAARGLWLEEVDGQVTKVAVRATPSVAAAWKEGRSFDLIMLAVKAYHTAEAAAELRAAQRGPTPVLTVQNGVGNEEALARALPGSEILAGVLTTPVEVQEPGRVKISRASFKFAVAPGPGCAGVDAAAEMMTQAGFRTQVFTEYRALKWSKLLMNILANAQAAILGYTPAQIFARPDLGNLEIEAWREAVRVMRGLGVEPVALAGYPLPLAAFLARRFPVGAVRPIFRRFIVGGRGDKMPSLYYDAHPAPRGRSEIRWLNGAVAAHGRELGVPTPVNSVFATVLQEIVEGKRAPEEWRARPQRLLEAIAKAQRSLTKD